MVWTDAPEGHSGRFFALSGVGTRPQPVQRPHPPIAVGGRAAAFRRAVRVGHEWYGYGLDPTETAAAIEGLHFALNTTPRPKALGPLPIRVAVFGEIDAGVARRVADLGVHALNYILPRQPTIANLDAYFRSAESVASGPSYSGRPVAWAQLAIS